MPRRWLKSLPLEMLKGNTKPSIDFLDSSYRPPSKQVDELYQTKPRNYFLAHELMSGQQSTSPKLGQPHSKPHESGRSDSAEEGSANFLVRCLINTSSNRESHYRIWDNIFTYSTKQKLIWTKPAYYSYFIKTHFKQMLHLRSVT